MKREWLEVAESVTPFALPELTVLILHNLGARFETDLEATRELQRMRLVCHALDGAVRHHFFARAQRLPVMGKFALSNAALALFPNLKRLSLNMKGWNRVYRADFPFNIVNLSRLEELDLSHSIFAVHNLDRLTGLKKLLLRWTYCVRDIGALTNLTELSLYENRGLNWFCLPLLTQLKSLNIGCAQSFHPHILRQLTSLTELRVKNGNAVKGEDLLLLTNLRRLTLSHPLDVQHSHYAQMTWLRHLCVKECDWLRDDALFSLTGLESLDLADSDAWRLTDAALMPLTNLTALNIGTDDLNLTNRSVSRLTRLRSLILDENSTITDACFAGLVGLERLSLRRNEFISWAGLSCLTRLTELDVTSVDQRFASIIFASATNLKRLRIDSDGLLGGTVSLERHDESLVWCDIQESTIGPMRLVDDECDDYCRDYSSYSDSSFSEEGSEES